MKRMELVDFELAFKEAVSAHKKVGWVSVFCKTIHSFKSFIFLVFLKYYSLACFYKIFIFFIIYDFIPINNLTLISIT